MYKYTRGHLLLHCFGPILELARFRRAKHKTLTNAVLYVISIRYLERRYKNTKIISKKQMRRVDFGRNGEEK